MNIYQLFKECKAPGFLAIIPADKDIKTADKIGIIINTKLLEDERFACFKACCDLDNETAFEKLLKFWGITALGMHNRVFISVKNLEEYEALKGLCYPLHQCGLATIMQTRVEDHTLKLYPPEVEIQDGHHVIGVDPTEAGYPCVFTGVIPKEEESYD